MLFIVSFSRMIFHSIAQQTQQTRKSQHKEEEDKGKLCAQLITSNIKQEGTKEERRQTSQRRQSRPKELHQSFTITVTMQKKKIRKNILGTLLVIIVMATMMTIIIIVVISRQDFHHQ